MDQDPGIFPPSVIDSTRRVVQIRYTLLPYLYTLFHRVHLSGGTVVRSMAHEFTMDSETWSLDEQFLWGSSLLIAPVVYQGDTKKNVYLPSSERWFNYYTGEEITTLGHIQVEAPRDYLPLYLRGGAIIPHQHSGMNTVESRNKPMYLYVTLDKDGTATGNLFWDDGESIDTYETSHYNYFTFNYAKNQLTIDSWSFSYPQMIDQIKLEEINIWGLMKEPTRISWNGQDLSKDKWTLDSNKKILKMNNLALNLSKTQRFVFL